MNNSEIHANLERRAEHLQKVWAMRQWYFDLLRRKERENAQQELFAETERYERVHSGRVFLWLAALVAGLALVMWLVGC